MVNMLTMINKSTIKMTATTATTTNIIMNMTTTTMTPTITLDNAATHF